MNSIGNKSEREPAIRVHWKFIVVKAHRQRCQDWILLSPAHAWVFIN